MIRQMHYLRTMGVMMTLVITSVVTGGDPSSTDTRRPQSKGVDPLQLQSTEPELRSRAIDVDDATPPLRLEVRAGSGYWNADGDLILDLMEDNRVYLTLWIEDAEGRPVQGLQPTITPNRDSHVLRVDSDAAGTDEHGNYTFGLMGGSMGEERVEIAAGKAAASVILNVISREASGYEWLKELDGVLHWDLLLQAEIVWSGLQGSATFPESVRSKSGQTVKLVGFMTPLETASKQRHFVLVSHPPSCFFHVPGGPAGSVEVFAKKPLDMTWAPVVLEGRFEALETVDIGVVYRLHEARSVRLARSSRGAASAGSERR